jgi:hypothetical protein
MPYVQRNGNNKVIGRFAFPQSYASEFLSDDHADLQPDTQDQIDALKAELRSIEETDIMNRRMREAYILLCLQQAQAAGLTEAQAYAVNPGYKGAKDVNTLCTNLRAQIRDLEDLL